MDILTALGMIQTMYGIIRAIYQLQQTVVKHKSEVTRFASFIVKIEKKLKVQEEYLERSGRAQRLPHEIATSLIELRNLLISSADLLEELQSYLSITHASRRIKDLSELINGVRLDIAFDMHFTDQQLISDGHPESGGSQPSTHLLTQSRVPLDPGFSSVAFPHHVQQFHNPSGHGGPAGVVNNIYVENLHVHLYTCTCNGGNINMRGRHL